MLLKQGVENKEYWFMFSGIDKLLHISIFALLGFVFRIGFPRMRFFIFFLIMFIYGLGTEILQREMHLGRSMELLDLFADLLGVLMGYFTYQKIKNDYF